MSGTVKLGGKPLPKATVSFQPVDGGRQSCGFTDPAGHYELRFVRDIMGARVGKHKVSIRTSGTEESDKTHQPELVPANFNLKTTLEREVKSGANQIDFDLPSR